jgi:hypothetical protein
MSYARVCQCGCRRELRKPDGSPDLRRRFFDSDCLARDKRERKQIKRSIKKATRKPRLIFEGEQILASTVSEFARELRRLGHSVQFLHLGRPAKVRAAAKG